MDNNGHCQAQRELYRGKLHFKCTQHFNAMHTLFFRKNESFKNTEAEFCKKSKNNKPKAKILKIM